jgi:hypothetical protein
VETRSFFTNKWDSGSLGNDLSQSTDMHHPDSSFPTVWLLPLKHVHRLCHQLHLPMEYVHAFSSDSFKLMTKIISLRLDR